MKTKYTKQTVLKGLLLAALATNISWDPAMQSLEAIDLQSSELAKSGGPSSRGSMGRSKNTPPLSMSPNGVGPSEKGIQPGEAAKATTERPGTEVKAETENKKEMDSSEVVTIQMKEQTGPQYKTEKFCGDYHRITYQQETVEGKTKTRVVAKPIDTQGSTLGLLLDGDLESVYGDEKTMTAINRSFENKIRQSRERIGAKCEGTLAKTQPAKKAPEQTEEDKKEKERLAKGIAECRLDQDGAVLTSSEKVDCNLERLASVELDINLSDKAARKKAMSEIESIVRGELKGPIKRMMMSKDEEDVATGEELVEQAYETVKELKESYGLDHSKTSKLLGELQSLSVAGKTYRESKDYESRVSDLRENFTESWSLFQQNPGNPYLQYRINALNYEQQRLMSELNYNMNYGNYARLNTYYTQGLLSASDFKEFTSPFDTVRDQITNVLNPNYTMPSILNASTNSIFSDYSLSMPTDLLGFRGNLNTNFSRNYGLNHFSMPTVRPGSIGGGSSMLGAPRAQPYSRF